MYFYIQEKGNQLIKSKEKLDSLEKALDECSKNPLCKGITFDKKKNKYTTRLSSLQVPAEEGKEMVSWIKKETKVPSTIKNNNESTNNESNNNESTNNEENNLGEEEYNGPFQSKYLHSGSKGPQVIKHAKIKNLDEAKLNVVNCLSVGVSL